MRRQAGLTLVELVMTLVIISVAIAGVLGAFSQLTARAADPLSQARAITLAQIYLDEILARKYDEDTGDGGVPAYTGACRIGVDAGESRDTFDDVDDYSGLNDQPPAFINAALSPVYSHFRVQVNVVCAGTDIGITAAEGKRIELIVILPDASVQAFSVYRGNF